MPTESVSVRDRGLHYGDGCFETIRLYHHIPLLLTEHLQRLHNACERLGIRCDESLLRGELQALIASCPADGVIKIIVTRGEGGRGYRGDANTPASRILLYYPPPENPAQKISEGVAVGICTYRLSENSHLAGLKHLNRLDQVLASTEFYEGVDEMLCLDRSDNVIEGTRSNLVLVIEDQLLTPDLDNAGVNGIMLAHLSQRFRENGTRLTSRVITVQDLRFASEIFLCNSVFGVWPVRKLTEDDTVQEWPLGPWTEQATRYHDEILLAADA